MTPDLWSTRRWWQNKRPCSRTGKREVGGGFRTVPAGAGRCRTSSAWRPSVRPARWGSRDKQGHGGGDLGDVRVHVLLEVHRQELEYQIELSLLQHEDRGRRIDDGG